MNLFFSCRRKLFHNDARSNTRRKSHTAVWPHALPPGSTRPGGHKWAAIVAAQRGFTLIELLVVLVIISLLAGVVGPRLFGQKERAARKTAAAQIRNIESALAIYELDNGAFPTTEEGLRALVEQPPSAQNWREGGYLEKGRVPNDPWGNPYVYVSPGSHTPEYDLKSYGADGVDGGEGKNADVESWNIQ